MFITRKVSKFQFNNTSIPLSKSENIELSVPTFILQQLLKKTLYSVGTGLLILIVILVIASKFKVVLILLPISFYLIGQFFVFNNHIKVIKNQKIIYNQRNHLLSVSSADNKNISFDLSTNQTKVKEFKSVQKNNGLLTGYFELSNTQGKCYIPYFIAANPNTKPFFDRITRINREVETKLFPVI